MAKKYPQYIIDKAIQLRVEKKYTVPEIADMMGIAKSTIDGWLKPYKLEERTQKQTYHQKRVAEANRENAAKKRDAAYNEGWEQAFELFQDPYFRDFINLYLAEGSKKQRNEVNIGNSNAKILILSKYWFDKFANPERKRFYGVQIHEDHDEDEIKFYWASQIGINTEDIRITRKSNSGKLKGRKFRSPYGVFTIEVSDTYFRAKLQAWMDYLEQDWLEKFTN